MWCPLLLLILLLLMKFSDEDDLRADVNAGVLDHQELLGVAWSNLPFQGCRVQMIFCQLFADTPGEPSSSGRVVYRL